MRNKLITITSVILLASLLVAGAAFAQSPTPAAPAAEPTRTINVTGTGKVTLTPDIAYVTIGVHTEGKDAAEPVAKNTALTKKVIDAIIALKVDPKDIRTTNFNIYPQQQYDAQGVLTGTLYMVDNSVYVTVRDLAKLGEILDAAVKAGANNINGIQFDVADKSKALSEARKLAVNDARTQAEELAAAAGVTLGPVLTISTSGSSPLPQYDGKGGAVMSAAVPAPVPVSPGQMDLTLDIYMIYQIK